MNVSKIIASFFGIGFIERGAGSVASVAFCVLLYLGRELVNYSDFQLLFFSCCIFFLGVYVSGKTETVWGKDSNKIVIDEVLGMAVSMLFLPINFQVLIAAFILFRFFDILKPFYIRRFEKFENGWGVMLDDLIAGIYTNVIIQLSLLFFLK